MNQVSELSLIVSDFDQWKATQYDKTIMKPPPPTPKEASSPDTPPPLPSYSGPPSGVIDGDVVDSLYSRISQPSIDIRKANEIQPEEPEIPDPEPTHVPDTVEREPSGDEDLFPTEGQASSEPQKFFTKAFTLPAERWPSEPGGDKPPRRPEPGEHAISFGEAADAVPAAQPAGGRAVDTRLEDFSVMVRLSRKGRKHKALVLGVLGTVLVAGIGAVLYLTLISGPVDLGLGLRENTIIPHFEQRLYNVVRDPVEEQQEIDSAVGAGTRKRSPRQMAHTRLHSPSPIRANETGAGSLDGPRGPAAVALGKIDPGAAEAFKRYAGLIENGSVKRREKTIDVKPKTMTDMPEHSMTKDGMDAFLSTKMRKFSDCKRRMSHPTDMPVKVGLNFNIGMDGRVGNILVDQHDADRDEGLDSCIRRVVGGWAFPPPDETTTFKTTLLL